MSGEDYFRELPEPYQSRALRAFRSDARLTPQFTVRVTLSDALNGSFYWNNTEEGHDFWNFVYTKLKVGKPLPPPVALSTLWPHKKNT